VVRLRGEVVVRTGEGAEPPEEVPRLEAAALKMEAGLQVAGRAVPEL
jgi:hypothetical protein